ncbi:MAG TPA: chemotaxis protein CheW [Firmicutes bacterium]|jgi:purine-binding chemotaxis protein CheW|nr:chemotaxis protein CheW [Bacillota bacterium]
METQGGKYLTFLLDEEKYGIPIKKVKEIIGMTEITDIPKTPIYIKGIVNLPGKVIPLMDLRLKLGMGEKPYNDGVCIIVIEVHLTETQRLVGMVVDAVADVVKIQKADIEPPPEYNVQSKGDVVTGISKLKDKIILILDIEKIFNRDELIRMEEKYLSGNENEHEQDTVVESMQIVD